MSEEKDLIKSSVLGSAPGSTSGTALKQSPRFEVSVKVTYEEKESRPEANYYFFSYKVKIKNLSKVPAQLMSRHWIITDAFGNSEEVRGAGVVGQQPKIEPGSEFEYESACPLTTSSGNMRGFYHFVRENGDAFDVEISEFYLIAPSALH